MLELKSAVFRNGSYRLHADWSAEPGDRVAVIGPSGSGKSTLLSGIAGFLPLIEGAIRWHDAPLTGAPHERPVSMLFQSHNLFPHLTVSQNVGLGLRPSLQFNEGDHAIIGKALRAVDLTGLDKRKPAELSGGQQSRVGLARTLVRAKPIILLDEPFAALGPAQRGDMLTRVTSLATELSALLIMVTHDPNEARQLGGKVVFVNEGIADRPMSVKTAFENPPDSLKEYLGA